jgi:Tfp pilus assembly protein PilV
MKMATNPTHAMTLIEVVLAMVVLGMVLGSIAQGVSLSMRMQRSTSERVKAGLLATELIEIIAAMPYLDPDGSATIGVDAGETVGDQLTFDDVDDFHGWSEGTVRLRNGTVRTDMTGWNRSVIVEWATLGSPLAAEIAETGTKRITVTVTHNGRTAATIDRLRFLGAESAME